MHRNAVEDVAPWSEGASEGVCEWREEEQRTTAACPPIQGTIILYEIPRVCDEDESPARCISYAICVSPRGHALM